MGNTNVIFTFDGRDIAIQCSKDEKARDVCQKFAGKAETNLNSLIFLYAGNQLNLELSLEAQASSLDIKNNEMKILVYRRENEDELICPNCGEKINLNTEKIDEIVLSSNNLRDTLSGIKDQLENVIKNSTINSINNELKEINIVLKTINEDINKINEKLQKLQHDIIESSNKENENKEKPKIPYKSELEMIKENKDDKYILKSILPFNIVEGEKLMAVNFFDDLQNIPIICKNTFKFNEVENLFYEKCPQYKGKDNYYVFFGSIIDINMTLKEIGIKDGDTILRQENIFGDS